MPRNRPPREEPQLPKELPYWGNRIRWYLGHMGREGVPFQWQTGKLQPKCSRCGSIDVLHPRPVPACGPCFDPVDQLVKEVRGEA